KGTQRLHAEQFETNSSLGEVLHGAKSGLGGSSEVTSGAGRAGCSPDNAELTEMSKLHLGEALSSLGAPEPEFVEAETFTACGVLVLGSLHTSRSDGSRECHISPDDSGKKSVRQECGWVPYIHDGTHRSQPLKRYS